MGTSATALPIIRISSTSARVPGTSTPEVSRWPAKRLMEKPTAPAAMPSLTQSATACFSSCVSGCESGPPGVSARLQRSSDAATRRG